MVLQEDHNFSEKDEITRSVANILNKNFDNFPDDIRNKLLLKLAEEEEVAYKIASILRKKFNKLPEDIRNELLVKLSYKEKNIEYIASVLQSKFNNIPENLRNELLIRLAYNDKAGRHIAKTVKFNFNKLPEDLTNRLLLKLAEKESTVEEVTLIIAKNFDNLQDNTRNLLFEFSKKEDTAIFVAQALKDNFDKLPENVRNELLLSLSEKYEIYVVIVGIIKVNFNKLPDNVITEALLKIYGKEALSTLPKNSEKNEIIRHISHIELHKHMESIRDFYIEEIKQKNFRVARVVAHLDNIIEYQMLEEDSNIIINEFDKKDSKKSTSELDITKISSISKLIDLKFPNHVNLNEQCQLIVRLVPQVTDETTNDMILAFGYAEGIKEIEVLVTLNAEGFEIEETRKKMVVPLIKNSEPIVFYLTPKSTGEKKIWLEFSQNENYNGGIIFKTIVYQEATEEKILNVVPVGTAGLYPSNKEQQDIRIDVRRNGDYLEYLVTSKKLDLFNERYCSQDKLHEPKKYMNNIFRNMNKINSLTYNDNEKYEYIINNIESLGIYLYQKLVPHQLKDLLWENKDINSIFIVSNEDVEWIPWEILKPSRITKTKKTEVDDFWGVKYAISRWISCHFPLDSISIKNSAIVANDCNGTLENVIREKECIKNILKEVGINNIINIEKHSEFKSLLSGNDIIINLLHFAVDSTYDESSPEDTFIQLDFPLTAIDISASNLTEGRPLIFMNACQSSRTDYTFIGAGGFTKAFLDIGASAFIGTIWEVPDKYSAKFSNEFYKNVFEKGMSLGEALRETKNKLRNSRNPSWLSYSLYGLPLIRVIV